MQYTTSPCNHPLATNIVTLNDNFVTKESGFILQRFTGMKFVMLLHSSLMCNRLFGSDGRYQESLRFRIRTSNREHHSKYSKGKHSVCFNKTSNLTMLLCRWCLGCFAFIQFRATWHIPCKEHILWSFLRWHARGKSTWKKHITLAQSLIFFQIECLSPRDARVASQLVNQNGNIYALRSISATTEFMMLGMLIIIAPCLNDTFWYW